MAHPPGDIELRAVTETLPALVFAQARDYPTSCVSALSRHDEPFCVRRPILIPRRVGKILNRLSAQRLDLRSGASANKNRVAIHYQLTPAAGWNILQINRFVEVR
jgi:hypothetical protein